MNNSELPAFANPGSDQGPGSSGLTKREYFAAMAMQGILSNNNGIGAIETIAQVVASDSIVIANELLKQLEQ